MVGSGALTLLRTIKNPCITYSQPSVPLVRHLQIQPTTDRVVLYYLLLKNPTYKWTCAIQTPVVQGSTEYKTDHFTPNYVLERVDDKMYISVEGKMKQ